MLCKQCIALTVSVLKSDYSSWQQRGPQIVFRHHSLHRIDSSATFCQFCAYFVSTFTQRHDGVDREQTTCYIAQDEVDIGKGLFMFVVELLRDAERVNFHSFELFLEHERLDTALGLGCQISDRPDSQQCIALAKNWLNVCETQHKCGRKTESPLPTRVLDLDGGSIKVITTQGNHARYVALSYCWGRGDHFRTLRSNLQAHMTGIAIEELPATLQDAITMTRLLGFRYLWIDALCIVQDEAEDWNREAQRMCSVYEQCALCLAVTSAASSFDGFFKARTISFVPATVMIDGENISIGVRAPSLSATRMIGAGPLETRAWTLQERVLPTASLHFTSDQMLWECCEGFGSEVQPGFKEDARGANANFYGMSVHDMKLLTHGEGIDDPAKLWYQLVEAFSERSLTNPADRLPAILGISQSFVKFGMTDFVSGIWLSSVHHGLLWSSSQSQRIESKASATNTMYPSWSWCSVRHAVNFNCIAFSIQDGEFIPQARIRMDNPDECGSPIELMPRTNTLRIETKLLSPLAFLPKRTDSCFREAISPLSKTAVDTVQCILDAPDLAQDSGSASFRALHIADVTHSTGAVQACFLIVKSVTRTIGEVSQPVFVRIGYGYHHRTSNGISLLEDASEDSTLLI